MAVSKGVTTSAMFFLFVFITLIFWAFYDYFMTPQFLILPLLVVFMFLFYIFTGNFGEWIPVIKPTLFLTEGGIVGVYLWHEETVGGMVTYYFSVRTKYARHCSYTDFQEKNAIMRFFTFLSNTRVCHITDYGNKFDQVPNANSDVPERAIIYRGTLRKGTSILSPISRMQQIIDLQNATISQIVTITEKAKTISEYAAQQQNKDMVDVGVQLGTVLDNINKNAMVIQRSMQQ